MFYRVTSYSRAGDKLESHDWHSPLYARDNAHDLLDAPSADMVVWEIIHNDEEFRQ